MCFSTRRVASGHDCTRCGPVPRQLAKWLRPLLLLLLSITPAAAQQSSSLTSPVVAPGHLTLGELYARIDHRNPKAAASRALAQAAWAREKGVSRPPDPQLQFGFMNYALPGLAPMPILGMTQLQLMQMIPLGGKLGSAKRVAGAQASAAQSRAEDVAWDVRARAAMMFYELYATDRGLEVARETLRLLAEVARTAEAMYRVGDGRQADVLRAEVGLARMVEDTLRMQAMREATMVAIGAMLDTAGVAVIASPALPVFPDEVPTRAWLDSIAADGRPMIRAGLQDVRAADQAEQLAGRSIIPDLTVGVQYAQQAGAMGATEHMGSLMFGVSVPVFARSRQLRMRDEAGAMREMAQSELASMRAETRGRIGAAYVALTRARRLSQLYLTTVIPQAEAASASALAAYRVGGVDLMTVLDDRMTVNQYRQQLHVLDAEQGKAWAELEMLVGRALINSSSIATPRSSSSGGPP